jgi:hypothetical protein
MTNKAIAQQRLCNQHLTLADFAQPADAVAWFGAVQAQDYTGALWAVGQRMPSASAASVEQAISDGSIVRTHPMRATWHFVAAADIRWLLPLIAPRNRTRHTYRQRELELDAATLAKSTDVFAKTLQGGQQRTRPELAAVLAQAGISPAGQRMVYLLMYAETEGIICSGARRGKQFTYALLEERVPLYQPLARAEALAELVRRYFTSHGPATVPDFCWWSSLTTAEARVGLEAAKTQLVQEKIDGQTYWRAPTTPSAPPDAPTAYLLPPYDEYTVAYRDRSAVLEPAHMEVTRNGIFSPIIVVDGLVVGTWKRSFSKRAVTVETSPFVALTPEQERAVAAATQRYQRFALGAGDALEASEES